jgi:tetratricopeptide (TPR) repeat protein
MDACIHYNLGDTLFQLGRYDEAITHYQWDLNYDGHDDLAQEGIFRALLAEGHLDVAIAHLMKFATPTPRNSQFICFFEQLGSLRYKRGERSEGIAMLKEVVRISPENIAALNDLAWMLATAPENSLRDGKKSIVFALQAVQMTGGSDPTMLDTLAAAYAETGDYAKALETARSALKFTQAIGGHENEDLAATLRREISLYELRKPLREP